MTRIQAVRRQHSPHEVFRVLVFQFRRIEIGSILQCTATGIIEVQVAQAYVLDGMPRDATNGHALPSFTWIKRRKFYFTSQGFLVHDGSRDIVEPEVTH